MSWSCLARCLCRDKANSRAKTGRRVDPEASSPGFTAPTSAPSARSAPTHKLTFSTYASNIKRNALVTLDFEQYKDTPVSLIQYSPKNNTQNGVKNLKYCLLFPKGFLFLASIYLYIVSTWLCRYHPAAIRPVQNRGPRAVCLVLHETWAYVDHT